MKAVLIKGGGLLNSYPFIFEKKNQFLLCQFRNPSNQMVNSKNSKEILGLSTFWTSKLEKIISDAWLCRP